MSEIETNPPPVERVDEKAVNENAVDFDSEKGLHTHDVTGLAVVDQGHTIPTTGERKPTKTWEYWAYCLYGKTSCRDNPPPPSPLSPRFPLFSSIRVPNPNHHSFNIHKNG